jgi:integrase
MVNVQRFIGGRPQDVCNMRAGDIERTGDVWTYRPYKHKTQHLNKERSLALGPQSQEILLPYIVRKADDEFIFSPADSIKRFRETQRENRKTKVQPSQRDRRKAQPKRKPGGQYDDHSYRRAIHRACGLAGIKRWSPNQLRHTAGTETTAQFGLEAAKEFLGHASIKTTEQYYIAPLPELAAKVARKIG